MSVFLIGRPIINLHSDRISRYVCSDQPISYRFTFSNVDYVAYPNYKVLLYIYELGTNKLLGQRYFRPLANLTIMYVDIQKFIKPYLKSQYNPDFSFGLNYREDQARLSFYIKYQEIFDNATQGALFSDEQFYATAITSTKQIGEKYGSNIGEYAGLATPDYELAKFVSDFKQPVMWRGWPFTLSFLYTAEMGSVQLKKIEKHTDINGGLINDTEYQLNTGQKNNINWLKVNTEVGNTTSYVKVKINTGTATLMEYVDEGYVDDGYTEEI